MPVLPTAADLQLKSVLVATDFSEASEKPLRHALAIARHYGAKFYLANVISSVGFDMAGLDACAAAEDLAHTDADALERDLVSTGMLDGLKHQIIIRRGREIWKDLQDIIREEHIDLVVIGTHARRGLGKLILGSTAEKIFRSADCLVLTVGPCSYRDAHVDPAQSNRTFLFATDFGEASLSALPFAISSANHFHARLVLLHVMPDIPIEEGPHWYTADDVARLREAADKECRDRLERELARHAGLAVAPEFLVDFGNPSQKILDMSARLKVDAIVLGLHHSKHIDSACRMPWATGYEVVCGARCPVLTVRK